MTSAMELKAQVPILRLCEGLGLSRSGFYQRTYPQKSSVDKEKKSHFRALSLVERGKVLETLHGERFKDASPAHVVATLLDEGSYLCSERTMYRLLAKNSGTSERRNLTQHGNFKRPELLATGPNQVWSWDITKLLGPQKWNYFYLYVLIDIFSRYVVGWMVADKESGQYAKVLIEESLQRENIQEGTLTIHSDRGGPMKSKPVGLLLADLGVIKSFSRPQVSNDNPFSEAQFKTLKYSPEFPERFGSLQDAVAFCKSFFAWYNGEHKHSGIGYYSPSHVHSGKALELEGLRNQTLLEAFQNNPHRFVNKIPIAQKVPGEVWINPPNKDSSSAILDDGRMAGCGPGQEGPHGQDAIDKSNNFNNPITKEVSPCPHDAA